MAGFSAPDVLLRSIERARDTKCGLIVGQRGSGSLLCSFGRCGLAVGHGLSLQAVAAIGDCSCSRAFPLRRAGSGGYVLRGRTWCFQGRRVSFSVYDLVAEGVGTKGGQEVLSGTADATLRDWFGRHGCGR